MREVRSWVALIVASAVAIGVIIVVSAFIYGTVVLSEILFGS
ncbi:MAG: hypothetical protein N3F67_02445 [Acidilobaceae archaeon]|nr:hypothetical protein [Acidilobaceae archaeon]